MAKSNTSDKFVPVNSVYNPNTDVAEVDQFGFTDMRQAFLTGMIDGNSTIDSEEYNGVEDAASLMGAPKDIFESTRQYSRYARAVSAAKSEDAAASSAVAE